jgi:hypothetical protein
LTTLCGGWTKKKRAKRKAYTEFAEDTEVAEESAEKE